LSVEILLSWAGAIASDPERLSSRIGARPQRGAGPQQALALLDLKGCVVAANALH